MNTDNLCTRYAAKQIQRPNKSAHLRRSTESYSCALLGVILASCARPIACNESAQDESATNPALILRRIGTARDVRAAEEIAMILRGEACPLTIRKLIRFGLGSMDERAVFGAAVLAAEPCPLAELRRAALVVVPRLGEATCPVSVDKTLAISGSVDVPSILKALSRLRDKDAQYLLGQVHRLLRAEHIPALCELAMNSELPIARLAHANAVLVALYSDENLEVVIETTLRLAGRKPRSSDTLIPSALREALEMNIEQHAAEIGKQPVERQSGVGVYENQWVPDNRLCARWLDRSVVAAADRELLERLLGLPLIRFAALRALGQLRDQETERLLRESKGGMSADFALARRGDRAALEALLDSESELALSLGLAAATPERRIEFCEELIAAPLESSLATASTIGALLRGVHDVEAVPYDEQWFAGIEAIAAEATQVQIPLLRALAGVLPHCATLRLADRLLDARAEELFEPLRSEEGEPIPWEEWNSGPYQGDLGFSGPWPFLEVSRPEDFLVRLREGLSSSDHLIRDFCGDQLLRLGDVASRELLLAWALDRESRGLSVRWMNLSALGGDSVHEEIMRRLERSGDWDELRLLCSACAVAQGMPISVAENWAIAENERKNVRRHLLSGSASAAWMESYEQGEGWPISLVLWRDSKIQEFVALNRESREFSDQLALGILEKDPASLQTISELCFEGRYATHHFFRGGRIWLDLDRLDFWIGETGTNCCRYTDSAASALRILFGREPSYSMSQTPEPLVSRLRRTLLPLKERLRWSRLASAYVVIGV